MRILFVFLLSILFANAAQNIVTYPPGSSGSGGTNVTSITITNNANYGSGVLTGTTPVIDFNTEQTKTWTLTNNATPTFANIPTSTNLTRSVTVVVNNTGSFTINWDDTVYWPPSDTEAQPIANTITTFVFKWDGVRTVGYVDQTSTSSSAALVYSGSTISISNTVTETAIFSNSIPANILGTNKTITLNLLGEYLNNSGGVSNFTVRVYLGTTEIYEDFVNPANVTQYSPYRLTCTVGARNSTSSQLMNLFIATSPSSSTTPATGLGRLNADALTRGPVRGFATEDSTTNLPFSVTITPQHAVGTMVWNNWYSVLYSQ